MTNADIVKMLRNMAAALEIKGANRFRIIAYDKAADSIEHLTSEVKDLWDDGKLDEIPGVGPTIAGHLDELFKTGKVTHFESEMKGLSPALFEFLLIPGLGPKRAYQLTKEFHILDPKTGVTQLEKAVTDGKVAQLDGWGEGSAANLLSNIQIYKRGQIKENRMPLPFADALAQEIIDYLKQVSGVVRVDALGSSRRKVATIGDIDLSAATENGEKVVEAFVKYPKVKKIIDQGPKGATVLLGVGRQVDIRVQHPRAYGAMLQYFTGSKHHNIKLREHALRKGLSLSEHGIKMVKKMSSSQFTARNYNKEKKLYEFGTEEKFYEAIGVPWMPPEIREDAGEIEAALQGKLPVLVEPQDIKGDLHIHSNYDLKSSHDVGNSSLEALLDTAHALGYEYIGISDHNPKMSGLSESEVVEIMKKRREKFEHIYTSWKKGVKSFGNAQDKRTQFFSMLEVDIDPKGKLALPEKAFEYVDAVIVSVHSSFQLSKDVMTQRILSGLSHPKAKILAHPTGRLLGEREGYDVDWEKLFAFCVEHNKAVEINSWPQRLDLPDRLVREAIKKGVKLVTSTDSHAAEHMFGMKYGVDVARRGWAEKKDILNTLGYNEFKKWLIS